MVSTLITPLSSNAKLGFGVATTYRPVGDSSKNEGTCSPKCPFLSTGECYAMHGLVKMQMLKSQSKDDSLERLKKRGVEFVRLHTSGDFFIDGDLDVAYFEEVLEFAFNNPKMVIWSYCHDVAKLIAKGYSYKNKSFPSNFHLLASVDSLEERTFVKSHGYRSARVIDAPEDRVTGEILCPYDKSLYLKVKPKVKCMTCGLCFKAKFDEFDIAFVKHGKKK